MEAPSINSVTARCLSPTELRWHGYPSPRAQYRVEPIQGGKTDNGEPLYIGRARHKGMLTIGKVQPSQGRLYVPYDHQEHTYTEYEVLVCKTMNL
ncbi:hypothetical protein MTO96_039317 [Rhipicephalus appendiculatus]